MYENINVSVKGMHFYQNAQVVIREQYKDGLLPLTPAIFQYLTSVCTKTTGQLSGISYRDIAEFFGCEVNSVRKCLQELEDKDWIYRPESVNPKRSGATSGYVIGPELTSRVAQFVSQRKVNRDKAKKNGMDPSISDEVFQRRIEELETRFAAERLHLRNKRQQRKLDPSTNGHYETAETINLMFGGYVEKAGTTEVHLDIA